MSRKWIEWNRGERPVSYHTMVDVRLRNGFEQRNLVAGTLNWENHGIRYSWQIVSYRISKGSEYKALIALYALFFAFAGVVVVSKTSLLLSKPCPQAPHEVTERETTQK